MSSPRQVAPDHGRRGHEDASAVRVGMTNGRGRGLFATRAMAKGEIVVIERPLVAMQSLDNTQDVMVCRNCLGFAGDAASQLELLTGVPRHECRQRYEHRHGNDEKDAAQRYGSLSGLHDCLQGCGEVYCSSECRAEHFKRGHRLLCVGPVPETEAHSHPLVAFRVHAMQTNEIFLLVGEVMAHIASKLLSGGDIAIARLPFADFVQEPWWDVAVPRESKVPCKGEVKGYEGSSLPETLRALCVESSRLLRSAFGPKLAPVEDVFTAEGFGRVVGMFEQNNVGVRVRSPIPLALQELVEGDGVADDVVALLREVEDMEEVYSSDDEGGCCDGKDSPCMEQESNSACTKQGVKGVDIEVELDEQEDDAIALLKRLSTSASDPEYGRGLDTDEVFAPLDGTALYSLICCMNHSCRPNCGVRYPGRRKGQGTRRADPLVAEVVLLRDVDEAEELTQSYVDKEMGLQERQEALEDYGFVCTCARCLEEEAGSTLEFS